MDRTQRKNIDDVEFNIDFGIVYQGDEFSLRHLLLYSYSDAHS